MKHLRKRLSAIVAVMSTAMLMLALVPAAAFAAGHTITIKEPSGNQASHEYEAYQVFTGTYDSTSKQLESIGFGNIPICVAKTQYSLTDDPKKLGAPKDFDITVRGVKVSAGAGFVVALTGDIMTMPGLPKVPAAVKIDVDEDGKITGLF